MGLIMSRLSQTFHNHNSGTGGGGSSSSSLLRYSPRFRLPRKIKQVGASTTSEDRSFLLPTLAVYSK
ncbi:hypothetical protein VitviT2T_022105 [Vitis vinifera]|uniref:Uncharacterized protein n=1 Tax=Vitis vinifera TaxID=29760 RepID=A0ABY9D8Y4_VITVI|nr:hypothetical protein VitviT2T_022105 [Vitis vinifera]